MKGIKKMIIKATNVSKIVENPPMGGSGILHLEKLNGFTPDCEALRTFAVATLEPGSEVGFHLHEGEMESYYIISGKALYNDNGTLVELAAGDVTYTPSGESHGIKNMSDSESLVFIALIIKN